MGAEFAPLTASLAPAMMNWFKKDTNKYYNHVNVYRETDKWEFR
jgi:hypothetical protein